MTQGYALSPQQRHYWRHFGETNRCAQLLIKIAGKISENALEQSLRLVVERHEMLRSYFVHPASFELPLQVIGEANIVWKETCDCTGMGDDEFADTLDKLLETLRSEDTVSRAKVTALLVRRDPSECIVMINIAAFHVDRRAMDVLFSELVHHYQLYVNGQSLSDIEEPVQYVDISEWQNDILAARESEHGKSYWLRSSFQDHLHAAQPSGKVASPGALFSGKPIASWVIDNEYLQRLSTTVSGLGTDIPSFLLALWQVLLYRLNKSAGVVVGVLHDGRNDEDTDTVIGIMAKYLPLNIIISDDHTLTDIVSLNAEQSHQGTMWFDCFSWELLPSQVTAEPSYIPYSFEFETVTPDINTDEALFSVHMKRVCHERFMLKLSCRHEQEKSRLVLDFETDDRIDHDSLLRLIGQYQCLLESSLDNPGTAIGQLDILPAVQRHSILKLFNDTYRNYQVAGSIHHLFEYQVEQTPHHPAVEFNGQARSYSELNTRANKFAHALHERGVGRHSVVGVYLRRSSDVIAAILAIFKTGATYLPLDVSYPKERIDYIIGDSHARLVICDADLAATVYDGKVMTFCPETINPDNDSDNNLPIDVDPDDAAYIIYTSGSTGLPKGTVVPHVSLVNHCLGVQDAYGITSRDRVLLFAPFSFDPSLEQSFPALVSGATVVVKDEGLWSVTEVSQKIREYQLSVVNFPSSYWHLLVQHWENQRPVLDSLRLVIAGGDRMLPEYAARWLALGLEPVRLLNAYGPTEATITATVFDVNQLSGVEFNDVPIGKSLPNRSAYVLDEYLQPLPINSTGELYLAGDCLASGYFNRPGLTAEKFVKDPFNGQPDKRMYKTGDRVFYSPDGQLHFVGRIDDQVKIRGYRVELGEIEQRISELPAIRQVAVVAQHPVGENDNKQLVAFYLADPSSNPGDEISAHLSEVLPEYMLPSQCVALTQMPMLPNGKIDRKALEKYSIQPTNTEVFQAPASASESTLVKLLQELTGRPTISVLENFIQLGGHSLMAMRLAARLQQELSVELSLNEIYKSRDLVEMASAIDNRIALIASGDMAATEPVMPRQREANSPLSYSQQRLWLLDEIGFGAQYHMPGAFRINGPLDERALQQTMDFMVNRHSGLRTRFALWDGTPRQYSETNTQVLIEHTDLSCAGQSRDWEIFLEQWAARPFNLGVAPLIRVALLKMDAQTRILAICMHHIISDGVSVSILLREISQVYAALVRGHTPRLPALPIDYADFAHWQRGNFSRDQLGRQLLYWRNKLAGYSNFEMPGDFPRPSRMKGSGGLVVKQLDRVALQRYKNFCQEAKITPYSLLVAAVYYLLGRNSGQNDFCIGMPVAGRARHEVQHIVGCFINTLVIRPNIQPEGKTIREFLLLIQHSVLEAQAHQDVPFEMLVEEIATTRDLGRNPIFQVLINYILAEEELSLAAADVSPIAVGYAAAKCDLAFDFTEDNSGGLQLSITYSDELYRKHSIEQLAQQALTVIENLAKGLDAPVDRIELLASEQQLQLLHEFNPEFPEQVIASASVHALFEAQVERTPQASAVVIGEKHYSYRDLNEKANNLAHYLIACGAQPESLIGLCVKRSLDLCVGVLGILKAGAAYVPLDPDYPRERLLHIVDDSGIQLFVSQAGLLDDVAFAEKTILHLDDGTTGQYLNQYDPKKSDNPAFHVQPENLAYVLYTSGSTGLPKGVMIEHGALCNFLHGASERLSLGTHTRWLALTTFGFDIAGLEMFGPLINGGCVYLADATQAADGHAIARLIERYGINTVQATPSGWRLLIDCGWRGKSSLDALCGGEALPPVLATQLQNRCHRLFNCYGPTEATIWSHMAEVSVDGGAVPVGGLLPGYRHYVINRHASQAFISRLDTTLLAPIGAVGELVLGGKSIARGYLNRPDLNQEKFLANPYSQDGTGRLYRTGDLVRWLPDGNLEFLGRIDHQIKIRGFRIELEEIEFQLSQLPGIRQAVVAARADRQGDTQLVAYLVTSDSEGESGIAQRVPAYKQALAQYLPHYMVPEHYVGLAALPLTPNGKIDRKNLPSINITSSVQSQYRAPGTALEQQLCTIWQEVLLMDRIGIDDNFFAIGGHSVLASRLISRVRDTLNREIPLRTLFDAQTIAAFAVALEEHRESAILPPVTRLDREAESVRLSFAQQRLWFLDRFGNGSTEYHMPAAFHLRGPLHIAALHNALSCVVERHEVLRTVFEGSAEGARQVVLQRYELPLFIEDFSHLDSAGRDAAVRTFMREKIAEPFDLTADLMMRMHVFKLADQEHIVLIVMHHIASDGWSIGLLINEFNQLYRAHLDEQKDPLDPLPVQYRDYAHWQHQWLGRDHLEAPIDYWLKQLAGMPLVHNLPLDKPRPARQQFNGSTCSSRIDNAVLHKIRVFCEQEGVTLFMFLQTAFSVLLGRYSNETDVVMGASVAGRTHKDLEKLVGFFVNTVVLRSDLSGNPGFTAFLQKNKHMILEGFTHQQVPFEVLVEAVNPERTMRHSPLFQVLLVLQNNARHSLDLPGLNASAVELENTGIKFDLELNIEETETGLSLSWHYNTALFLADTIERMANNFRVLLDGILVTPNQAIQLLPLLHCDEKHWLLAQHQRVQDKHAQSPSVLALFERYAEKFPAHTAVVFEDKQLTYGELNERSNRMAHYLINAGIGGGDLVGLCMERSIGMIVTLLAVLKAGAAYIPLDPNFPRERLHYVLEDSKARLIITSGSLLDLMPHDAARTIMCVDSDDVVQKLAVQPGSNPSLDIKRNQAMYVIYTSGSTGNPKGVIVEHHNVARLFTSASQHFHFTEEDVWTLFHSFAFDFSVWEIWGALAHGGKLIIVPATATRDAAMFRDLLVRERVTVLSQIPTVFYSLARVMVEPGLTHHLNTVVFGGEALDYSQLKPWFEHFGDTRTQLVNMYGITETTVHVTYKLIRSDDVNNWSSNIGHTLDDLSAVVCDEYQQMVPIGVVGELLVGGGGVSRGYLNRPELTNARFILDPFTPESIIQESFVQSPTRGNKLYRTGDLVRRLNDGSLDYIGRIDNQVKIRGFRMELGEIEYHLVAIDGIDEAVVVASSISGHEKRLVGYVVDSQAPGDSDARNSRIAEIIEALKRVLPEYMVPRVYVFMTAMPLTPSGKVNRKALPAPQEQDLQKNAYVPAENPLQQTLCEIWRSHLQLGQVGIDDNYFALGGDSIRALNIVALAEKQDVLFSVTDIFQYPTIRGLAQAIEHSAHEKTLATNDAHELQKLLEDIENMSEEDVESQLEDIK
ncbi:hypothetical protein CBP51_05060 [Cellvibrio mixtus]|uniref:Carrier domain-containing protein n=1 Tax=Cellvibrio mixtus TaxID=39650 RepID=A0A266QAM6_9GAMM|nr:non-ribosomal peptide synthetase [Cellvibrio mixtus]OZY86399.1 hypothetical protein CBP51_05060 [Cellvibrio mixtus]